MWCLVFFDLPSTSPQLMKAYRRFRQYLLHQGFFRFQNSLYLRWDSSEAIRQTMDNINNRLPRDGHVAVIPITEKRMLSGHFAENGKLVPPPQKTEDFLIF